jgi:pentatricopeptide repeat protein
VVPTHSPSDHIKTLVSKGHYHQTLQFFTQLHFSGHHFNSIPFVLPSVIKACSFTHLYAFGTQLHCSALVTGSYTDPIVSNSIISMYAKFSDIESARQVFDTMPHRDTITWNSMINAYLQNGLLVEALQILKDFYFLGFLPKPELLASMVSMCGREMSLGWRIGRQIHGLVVVDGRIRIQHSVFLSTAFVDFYFRCGDSLMARSVFDGMEMKNEVSWTAVISGCANNQDYDVALACYREMQVGGVNPNRVTLIALLPACARPGFVKYGKEIHGYAFRYGFDSCHSFASALINMYCECGESLHLAERIFERSSLRDVVLWSSIIGSYARRGESDKALKLFNKMRTEETEPNYVTLLAVISACTNLSSLKHGGVIHGYILKFGIGFSIFVCNALINMYAKCGSIDDSCKIFLEMPNRDSVTWSSMISAYGLHGYGEQALQLFYEMKERGVKPDAVTFLAVLSACNHTGLVTEGQQLFEQVNADCEIPITIEHYACLIDLHGRSGKLEDALEILRTMPMKPSARIWSSLVSACKLHGRLDIAESLSSQLIRSEPNNASNYTLLSMIHAEKGHWLDIEQLRETMKLQRLRKCYGFSRIEAGH